MIRWVALLMVLPGGALACACCAEKGERFEHRVEMKQWELSELARLQASSPAVLFVTACDLDCVRGIDDPQYEYGVEMAVSEAGIDFDLSDAEGHPRGTLSFDWPEHYTYFGVDPAPLAEGGDAVLYTEIRFEGEMHGTGDFAGPGVMQAELVFAGHGNMCFDVGGLEYWRVTAKGADADYRLFGGVSDEL